ncbi:hypothetical protein SSX86_004289 [Deinandra increscens subsp. villosa]|uniref:SHSP domain-containing protein n=1 Tax=Deinandra increscens subsp. villosa TaxID=3103831 RepID=A0AAP0H7H8_9ASTR
MDFKLDLKLENELDLSISKNEPVVVFTTHQTDSMFILTFDLKKGGYGRNDIKIEINEDGSRMTVIGENPNINRRGFYKIFTIPQGVKLDKVKARFDQDQSRLAIRMPKLVKGIAGIGIQEVKDPDPVPGTSKENVDDEIKDSEQVEDNADTKKVATYTTPMIAAGSTLLVSLIVALFTFIRSKNQSTKKTT